MKYAAGTFIIIFFILLSYWAFVVELSTSYTKDANTYAEKSSFIWFDIIKYDIENKKSQSDSCARVKDSLNAIAKYLYNKADNTITLIPKILRP